MAQDASWAPDPQGLSDTLDKRMDHRAEKMSALHEMRSTLLNMVIREDRNIGQHLTLAMVEIDKALLLHEIAQHKDRDYQSNVGEGWGSSLTAED